MQTRYLVSYDIRDKRRLRQVYKVMRGWGDHTQLSVFVCDLSPKERVQLRAALASVIDHAADQVLFADLGPPEGRGRDCVTSLGKPYAAPARRAIIL
ncbi:MAG: CRISPR-associated endonuclease Cas2 [Myxococcales bacterium]